MVGRGISYKPLPLYQFLSSICGVWFVFTSCKHGETSRRPSWALPAFKKKKKKSVEGWELKNQSSAAGSILWKIPTTICSSSKAIHLFRFGMRSRFRPASPGNKEGRIWSGFDLTKLRLVTSRPCSEDPLKLISGNLSKLGWNEHIQLAELPLYARFTFISNAISVETECFLLLRPPPVQRPEQTGVGHRELLEPPGAEGHLHVWAGKSQPAPKVLHRQPQQRWRKSRYSSVSYSVHNISWTQHFPSFNLCWSRASCQKELSDLKFIWRFGSAIKWWHHIIWQDLLQEGKRSCELITPHVMNDFITRGWFILSETICNVPKKNYTTEPFNPN